MSTQIELIQKLYSDSKSPTILFNGSFQMIWHNEAANDIIQSGFNGLLQHLCLLPDVIDPHTFFSLGKAHNFTGNPLLKIRQALLTPFGAGKELLVLAALTLCAEEEKLPPLHQIIAMVTAQYREPVFAIHNLLGITRASMDRHGYYEEFETLDAVSLKSYQTLRATTNIANYFKYYIAEWVPKLERANINQSLEDFCTQVRFLIRKAGITLRFENCEEQIVSAIEPELMSAALLNIIANSCLYTNPENEIVVRLMQQKNDYVITITDQGVGMMPEVQEKAFQAFYSYDPNGGFASGVGLGLSIVRQAAERHCGTCLLTSEFNHGTTVALKLPITRTNGDKAPLESPLSDEFNNKFSPLYVHLADICHLQTIDIL